MNATSSGNRRRNIFINYRVHDTAGETGRLVDRLKQHFYPDQIFMDIDKIEPGLDFTKAIAKSLESCDIMLAVIGPNWLGKKEGSDTTRIKEKNDWVKTEIATALERDIRVIPVLVDGGELPAAAELPEDLQPLLLRQTYEISNKRWDYDTGELIKFLKRQGVQSRPEANVTNDVKPKKSFLARFSWLGFILIGIIIAAVILSKDTDTSNGLDQSPNLDKTSSSSGQSTDPSPGNNPTNQAEVQQPLSQPATSSSNANVDGYWKEIDQGETSEFDIIQNGNILSTDVYLMNQLVSSGGGSITGKNLTLSVMMFGVNATINGVVSDDGKTINGTLYVPSTGQRAPIKFVKQHD